MHFNFHDAIALTGFTPTTFDIKTKAAWVIATRACFGRAGEELTNRCEQPCVGGGITARCTTNWALIDTDDFVKIFKTSHA